MKICDYSLQTVAAFKTIVAAHASQLSYADYLRPLFKCQGSPIDRRLMPLKDALYHDISISEWIENHVSDSGLPAADWMKFVGGRPRK